ncbi:MAG: LacI family DNA-binding transcriptional regulator [Anaerolineaceae bacterium]|nr:LacI family DNA-binding transcriptional regulator [Anaerolineaceae bacterium]
MATIEDVAKRAGVSVSTVSYALSGKRPVALETRKRILAIIEEMEYHPHAMASGLASRRSRILGILYPTETRALSEGQLDLILNMTQTATQNGYSVMLWSTPLRPEEVWKLARQYLLDGAILTEVARHDPRVELLKSKEFPFVMLGRIHDNTGISFVDIDFADTLRQCVEHLASLGHSEIAFINGSHELLRSETNWTLCALEGFTRAVNDHQLHGEVYYCMPTPEHAYELVNDLLAQRPELTAIIIVTDSIAPGVLRALNEANLRIPEDFSVISNFPARTAELASPALTSLEKVPPGQEIGCLAANVLIDRLEGRSHGPVQILLTPSLVTHQSSGPRRG